METTLRDSMLRRGNFTSSEIIALLSVGKRAMTPEELKARPENGKGSSVKLIDDMNSIGPAALTYIQECNFERALGRPLETECFARPLMWGHLGEKRVFQIVDTAYKLVSHDTIIHSTYDYWAGSPDAQKFDEGGTVVDFKCPISPKSFCQLVEPLYLEKPLSGMDAMNFVRQHHNDGDKYYWQLVSNSILTDSQYAELIIYCPYKSELEDIRDIARLADGADMKKYYWVVNAGDDELPFIPDGGKYRNVNVIRFEVPNSDRNLLIDRVRICGKLLDNHF